MNGTRLTSVQRGVVLPVTGRGTRPYLASLAAAGAPPLRAAWLAYSGTHSAVGLAHGDTVILHCH